MFLLLPYIVNGYNQWPLVISGISSAWCARCVYISNHKETNFYYYKLFNLTHSSVKYICIRCCCNMTEYSAISIYFLRSQLATCNSFKWNLCGAFRNFKIYISINENGRNHPFAIHTLLIRRRNLYWPFESAYSRYAKIFFESLE